MLVTTPNKKKEAKPNVRRNTGKKGEGSNGTGGRNGKSTRGRRKGNAGPSHGTRKANGSDSGGWLSRLGLSPGGSNGSASGATMGPDHGRRVKQKSGGGISLPNVKPWKVILGALVLGGFGVLYLNHVFATQELLREVQNLEREYNQVRRANEDLRLNYDRMIGPAEIYENAKELGFINGGPAEKVIEVNRDE